MAFTETADGLSERMLKRRLFVVHSHLVGAPATLRTYVVEHLEHQIAMEKRGVLFAAGPYLDGDGTPTGDGLIILRASDRAEAERIAASDPFHRHGVRTFEVRPWQLNEGRIGVSFDFSDQTYALF